jgi:hypothetical protein
VVLNFKYKYDCPTNCDLSLSTRNCDKLAVPKFRLHKTGDSFFSKCIQIYNKIPRNVTKLPLHKLKQTVKKTLTKQGYYKVEDYFRR